MKKKKIIYIIGVLVIVGALSATYYMKNSYKSNKSIVTKTKSVQSNKVNLVIDTENKDVLPKKFRTTNDTINSEQAGKTS